MALDESPQCVFYLILWSRAYSIFNRTPINKETSRILWNLNLKTSTLVHVM
jgi:hypothetical protein